MGQARRRKQTLGAAYALSWAERAAALVRPVGFQTAVDRLTPIPQTEEGGHCAMTAALAWMLSGAPDWEIHAGTVLMRHPDRGRWFTPWMQGHAWVVNHSGDGIVDASIPTWDDVMKALDWPWPEELRAGVAEPDLLPLLRRLSAEEQIGGCNVLYLPGVHPLKVAEEYGVLSDGWIAESLHGGDWWQRLIAETALAGNCTKAVLVRAVKLGIIPNPITGDHP